MWRELTTFAALPIGLALAALVAPWLRQMLGALIGAVAVGAGAGLLVWTMTRVSFVALVIGGMAFAFALLGSGAGRGRWASRGGGASSLPSGMPHRGSGGRPGGGASGSW